MNLLGVALRKPTFTEVTAAGVMASGLWLAAVAASQAFGTALDRVDAGALLLVIFWGCVGVRLGIRLNQGLRHVALNLCGCAVVVAIYQGAISLLA